MSEETSECLVVVPTTESDATELIRRLNIAGYAEVVQIKDADTLMSALGYEPTDIDEVDLEEYAKWRKSILSYVGGNYRHERALTGLLGHVAMALTDIAETHKRSMPPVM